MLPLLLLCLQVCLAAYNQPDAPYSPPKDEKYAAQPDVYNEHQPEKEVYKAPEKEYSEEYENPAYPKESKLVSINMDNTYFRQSRYPEPPHTECIDTYAEKGNGKHFADVTVCFDPDLAETGISLCCPPDEEHNEQYGHYYPDPYEPYDYYHAAQPQQPYWNPPGYGGFYPYEKRSGDSGKTQDEDVDLLYVQPGSYVECRISREEQIEEFLKLAYDQAPFPTPRLRTLLSAPQNYEGLALAALEHNNRIIEEGFFDEYSVYKNSWQPTFQGPVAIARQFLRYQKNGQVDDFFETVLKNISNIHWDDDTQTAQVSASVEFTTELLSPSTPAGREPEDVKIVTFKFKLKWRHPCTPFWSEMADDIIDHVHADFDTKKDLLNYAKLTSSYAYLNDLEDQNSNIDTVVRTFCAIATGKVNEFPESFLNNFQPDLYEVCDGSEKQYGGDFNACVSAVKNQASRCGITKQFDTGDTTGCRVSWLEAVAVPYQGERGAPCSYLGENSPGCPSYELKDYNPNKGYDYKPKTDYGYQPGPDYGYQPGPDYGYQPGPDYGYQPGPYQPDPDYGYQPNPYDNGGNNGYTPNPGHPDYSPFQYNPQSSYNNYPYKRQYPGDYGNSGYGYPPSDHYHHVPPPEQKSCPCNAYEAQVTFYDDTTCGGGGGDYDGYWKYGDQMTMTDHFNFGECCEVETSDFGSWRKVSCNGKHSYHADLFKDAHCSVIQHVIEKPKEDVNTDYPDYGGYQQGYYSKRSIHPTDGGGGSSSSGGDTSASATAETAPEEKKKGKHAKHGPQEDYDVNFDICEVFEDSYTSRFVNFPTVYGYPYFPCADKGPFGYLVPVTYIFTNEYGQFAFDQLMTVKPLIERDPSDYKTVKGDTIGHDKEHNNYKRSSHEPFVSQGGSTSGSSSSGDGENAKEHEWKGKYKLIQGAPVRHESNFIPYFGHGKYERLRGRASSAGFQSYGKENESDLLIYIEFDDYAPRDDEYSPEDYVDKESMSNEPQQHYEPDQQHEVHPEKPYEAEGEQYAAEGEHYVAEGHVDEGKGDNYDGEA